jgi:hypothetical protein
MTAKTQAEAPTRVDPKSPEQAARDAKVLLSSALFSAVIAASALFGSLAFFH